MNTLLSKLRMSNVHDLDMECKLVYCMARKKPYDSQSGRTIDDWITSDDQTQPLLDQRYSKDPGELAVKAFKEFVDLIGSENKSKLYATGETVILLCLQQIAVDSNIDIASADGKFKSTCKLMKKHGVDLIEINFIKTGTLECAIDIFKRMLHGTSEEKAFQWYCSSMDVNDDIERVRRFGRGIVADGIYTLLH